MKSIISPSHILYYTHIHHQLIWLKGIFFIPKNQPVGILRVFERLSKKFPTKGSISILNTQSLMDFLDDTPVDSFLRNLCDEKETLERSIYHYLVDELQEKNNLPQNDVLYSILETSMLFGRNLAQEALLSGLFPLKASEESFDTETLWDLICIILGGGNWPHRKFLLRRCTPQELSYELLLSPFKRLSELPPSHLKLANQIEEALFRGFLESLFPRGSYERRIQTAPRCSDFIFVHNEIL